MTIDDIMTPDEIVCPHCGKKCEYDELFPVEEFGDVLPPEKRLIPERVAPREITYWMDHRVDVKVDGRMERVAATEGAIELVRDYMKTLPEGYRLVQACPKRIIDASSGIVRTHWIVRCIMVRKSSHLDLEWFGLLDQRESGVPF